MRKKKTRKTVLDKVIPYQSLTGCAFSLRSKRGRKFWARPVKPFGRGRPWLRWTRAVMQIQLRKRARIVDATPDSRAAAYKDGLISDGEESVEANCFRAR